MRALYVVLSGLAVVSAALQFNDPDPLYWIAVYAGAAAVIAATAIGHFSRFWAALVAGGAVAGMLMTAPGFLTWLGSGDYAALWGQMMAGKPYVEESREFLGLAIVLAALALCFRAPGAAPPRP